jgi:hypothetical protein
MTDKVLPGASREALGFIAVHWKSLLKMSIIPFLAYLIVSIIQIKSAGAMYRAMGNAGATGMSPDFMSAYTRSMGVSLFGSLVAFSLLGLLFAQIIRFQKTGVADWLMTDKAGIVAGLMTLVYGIGITMLTLLVYLGCVFGFGILAVIVGLVFGAVFGGNAVAGVLAALLGFVGILALLAGLYWFMFRFMVGLPGVALGSSPDFFKDMWPLSKGESWGLPLRMILASLVAYVPMLVVLGIFAWPAIVDMVSKMPQPGSAENPAVMFPVMADLMDRMLPATVAMMAVYIPFMWFMTLLLGIAFQRFRGRTV